MRWLRVFIVFFAFIFTGLILNSCCKGYDYKWSYILTNNLEQNSISFMDSIPKEKFGIRVNLFKRRFASNFEGLFIQQAHAAYDCYPTYTTIDSIINIKIITLTNLTPEKEAYSDITDLFLAHSVDFSSRGNLPVPELISMINKDDYIAIDYIDLIYNYNELFDAAHQFLIEVHLSDNRVLADTTNPVFIY